MTYYAENLKAIANKAREEQRARDKAQSIRLLNTRINPLMKENAEKGDMIMNYTVTDENINLVYIVDELEYRGFKVTVNKVNNRVLMISWE